MIIMKMTKLFFALLALIMVSCECPYQDELDRAQQRKTTGDVFHAHPLPGFVQEIAEAGGLIEYIKKKG